MANYKDSFSLSSLGGFQSNGSGWFVGLGCGFVYNQPISQKEGRNIDGSTLSVKVLKTKKNTRYRALKKATCHNHFQQGTQRIPKTHATEELHHLFFFCLGLLTLRRSIRTSHQNLILEATESATRRIFVSIQRKMLQHKDEIPTL